MKKEKKCPIRFLPILEPMCSLNKVKLRKKALLRKYCLGTVSSYKYENASRVFISYFKDIFFFQVALNKTHLRYVMSFLPVARSSATLDYFYALQSEGSELIGDDRTEIVAMDLGLKETLFHEYLVEDAVYLAVALGFISVAILCYTQSVFITVATLLAITYALSLAYFIYTFVCGIKFFPFMNVLAAVIAIGKLILRCFFLAI